MEAPVAHACIFCRIVAGDEPCSAFYEDDDFLGFLDVFPWRPGHALVVPRHHAQHLTELPSGLDERIWRIGLDVAAAMRAGAVPCDAVHFLLNDGRAAFQTVPHTHLHVIPRRRGDALGAVLGLATRPIPLKRRAPRESLEAIARSIREHLVRD